jgi:hypothetical protein
MQFEGFTIEDFDAYLPEKWSSNMFTLPRRKVRDRLEQLGRKLGEVFQSVDIELIPHLSDDHPSLWNNKKVDIQWLFFSRNETARKEITEIIDTERTLAATLADPTPLYRHIFIGVALDQHGIEVGVRLHFDAWVDRKNLLALISDAEKGDALANLIREGLGGDYLCGISDDGEVPAAGITAAFIAQAAAPTS